jgi:hypothetical protein
MFLDPYYSYIDGHIRITAEQASRFAKQVAGDFNPIHDPDAKRFCVPGDLLFSLVLAKYGLSQQMRFTFSGMVGHGVNLKFAETSNDKFDIGDDAGKTYLHVERHGAVSHDKTLIEAFTRSYVAFSGQNFPHILVPLMAEHNVMINAERPLVIYESMTFDLNHLDFTNPALELTSATLDENGKRGDAQIHFRVKAGAETAGTGSKKLVLSGLREYDHNQIQELSEKYAQWKSAYQHS